MTRDEWVRGRETVSGIERRRIYDVIVIANVCGWMWMTATETIYDDRMWMGVIAYVTHAFHIHRHIQISYNTVYYRMAGGSLMELTVYDYQYIYIYMCAYN